MIGLLAAAVLTRWPLRGRSLEEYDSVNYAFAIGELNLEQHYPHPPGYIFFVWASRLARRFTADDVAALTAVNALSGIASLALLYALLRVSLRPAPALLSVALYTASAQAWFQHVRPMEDAFAFLWMLAAAYPFVRFAPPDRRGWLAGMFLLALSAGAKQILPLFLAGLPLRAALALVRERRWGTLALGGALAIGGSLAWLVPLSVAAGSLPRYLAWAHTQAVWQRREALLVNLAWDVAWERARASFLLVWTDPGLAALFGALALAGAWTVLRRRRQHLWLLWLLGPLLLVRFSLLGYWTRFSIYYLPFLLALAACALEALAERAGALAARQAGLRAADAAGEVRRRAFVALSLGALLVWAPLQAEYILPTLRTLRDASAPMARAAGFLRQRYDPATTLVLLPRDVPPLRRHAEYYLSRAGFAFADEADRFAARTRRAIVRLEGQRTPRVDEAWYGSPRALGFWSLDVPHWDELSLWSSLWHVGLFELSGPYVSYYDWTEEGDPEQPDARCARAEGSVILLLRTPGRGVRLRLTSRGSEAAPALRVNRRPALGWREPRGALFLDIVPEMVVNGRARVDVLPDCPSSRERRPPADCFCLVELAVSQLEPARTAAPGSPPATPAAPSP